MPRRPRCRPFSGCGSATVSIPGPDGISSPTVVPCGQPHDAEVYARFALAGHSWPGGAAIGAQARQGCTARLGGYLNPQLATSVLAESYVFPDQGAWNAGERDDYLRNP